MQELRSSLVRLTEAEKDDILRDFQEYFDMGLTEGKTEEEIVAALGSPQQLAKDLQANYHVEQAQAHTSTGNVFRAIWAVIGLGFLNLILVLGPFIAIAAAILALWIAAFSFIIQLAGPVIQLIVGADDFYLFHLFASITIAGIGILLALGMYFVTIYTLRWFVRYLAFNIRIVKGES